MSDRYLRISLLDLGGIGIVDSRERKLIARCDRPEHARLIARALNELEPCVGGHEPELGDPVEVLELSEVRRCARCGIEFVQHDDGTQAEVEA